MDDVDGEDDDDEEEDALEEEGTKQTLIDLLRFPQLESSSMIKDLNHHKYTFYDEYLMHFYLRLYRFYCLNEKNATFFRG